MSRLFSRQMCLFPCSPLFQSIDCRTRMFLGLEKRTVTDPTCIGFLSRPAKIAHLQCALSPTADDEPYNS